MIRGLVLVLALASCAQGAELEYVDLSGPFVLRAASPELDLEPCRIAFDPAPELLDATERAAGRWSAATGCDVHVQSGGIVIAVLPEVIDNSGKATRARTTTVWIDGILHTNRIEFRADSLDQAERIIPHEMGHALGGYGHAETGLMKEAPGNSEPIDAASLELVCSTLPCAWLSPEPLPVRD